MPLQQTRIGERAFERMVLGGKDGAECVEVSREDVYSTGIDGAQTLLANQNVEGRAVLCARFGQRERASRESQTRPGCGGQRVRRRAGASVNARRSSSEALAKGHPLLLMAMRLPTRRNSRTVRPSAAAGGGCAVRRRNGLFSRTRSTGWPTMRGSSASR